MGKVFWFDCETTGLDHKECAIWQLAGIVEVGGEIVEEFSLLASPAGYKIEDKAMEVGGVKAVDLMGHPSQKELYATLNARLKKYVNKYDKTDKFVPGGYNVAFDLEFLRELWKRNDDKYFGSWFYNAWIDVRCNVAQAVAYYNFPVNGNFKLGTVCGTIGVELDAHEAGSDIRATRDVYYSLKSLV